MIDVALLRAAEESEEDELDFEAISIEKVKLRRVGTSLTLSHFFNCTRRNSVTGKVVMKEDRYIPGFVLVDLFGRRRLIGTPEELMEDERSSFFYFKYCIMLYFAIAL